MPKTSARALRSLKIVSKNHSGLHSRSIAMPDAMLIEALYLLYHVHHQIIVHDYFHRGTTSLRNEEGSTFCYGEFDGKSIEVRVIPLSETPENIGRYVMIPRTDS